MERKRADEQEALPMSQPKTDRFGFVKHETGSPDGLAKSRSASEYERYSLYGSICSCSLNLLYFKCHYIRSAFWFF